MNTQDAVTYTIIDPFRSLRRSGCEFHSSVTILAISKKNVNNKIIDEISYSSVPRFPRTDVTINGPLPLDILSTSLKAYKFSSGFSRSSI